MPRVTFSEEVASELKTERLSSFVLLSSLEAISVIVGYLAPKPE